jgi:ABC-type branched-subunit amino acid transport system substrate-binding protein
MNSALRRIVVGLAAMSLLAAACGDDDEGDSATTTEVPDGADGTATTSGEATPTGEPILLGVIAEGEGTTPASPNLDAALDATRAAATAVNADGGVAGRPLEIVGCDTRGDPNGAAECGREMVDQGVVALVGTFSGFSAGFLPVTEAAGIPSVGHFIGGAADLGATLTYPIMTGSPGLIAGQGFLAGELGCERPSIARNESDVVAQAVGLVNIGLSASGLEVANEVTFPFNAPDMSSFVAAATRDGVDCIIAITIDQDLVTFVRALRQSGSEVSVISVGNNIGRAIANGFGEDLNGVYGVSFLVPPTETDDPDVQRYLEELDAENPDAVKDELSENAWASVHMFADVTEGLDTIDSASVVAALNALDSYDPPLGPPVDFTTPQQTIPGARIFATGVMFTLVEDGEITSLTGEFVDVL